jgi:intracellular septation protein A
LKALSADPGGDLAWMVALVSLMKEIQGFFDRKTSLTRILSKKALDLPTRTWHPFSLQWAIQ